MLNRLKTSKLHAFDTETSGLDWKRSHIVGYVLTFGPAPQDSYYVPFRHLGNANVGGHAGPLMATNWDGSLWPGEKELVTAIDRQGTTMVGHHLNFDLKFLRRVGFQFNPRCEDTMINAPLLNEHQGRFSLEFCANVEGVQAKKSGAMIAHLCAKFPEAAKDPKKAMGQFWRLAGDDPVAVEYAEGDGTTTLQLRAKQMPKLDKEELLRVWDVECRLIPMLARMSCRGIRINQEKLTALQKYIKQQIGDGSDAFPGELMQAFGRDFNVRSSVDVKWWMEQHGQTDWPTTAASKRFPHGQPSFTQGWLEESEAGRQIVKVRKLATLRDTFVLPLQTTHLFNGRVHTNYNQLRGDEGFGTGPGRLSSNDPNLQAVPKHDEEIGYIYRELFEPDDGMTWGSPDYNQCLAAGTKVMVPSGTRNIEDMKAGDLVYSYDNRRNLVLRRVTWAGQTGLRSVCRVKWITNGRTKGHLDITADHKIRLLDGTYKTVSELAEAATKGYRSRYPYFIRVLALRRGVINTYGDKRNWLWMTGTARVKESRFVFEQVNGWSPEEVHHIDDNSLNDVPSNLEGLTGIEHRKRHLPYGMSRLDALQRKERSLIATRALQRKFLVNNHCITHIVPLIGEQPVYDITVEDTHNFIANEICVHNCEPRLLAFYSRCRVLMQGYLSAPPIDAHTSVSAAANRNWPNMTDKERKEYRNNFGKRINQTIITGGGKNVLVRKYKIPADEVDQVWNDYFRAMPEIRAIQKRMSLRMRQRGYILTLLGRRCRLNDPDKDYVALNRALQGGNADILKLKLVECDEYLRSEGYPIDILNNCHDAVDFQFHPDQRKHYERCLDIMQDFTSDGAVIKLDIPIPVDGGEGPNWAVATYGAKK